MVFGDGLAFEEKEVVYFFVELAEPLEVLGIFDFVTGDLVSVFPGSDRLVLPLGLLADFGFEELGVIVWVALAVLIWRAMIFMSRASLEKIFLMAVSLSSRISDSESLSSR